MVLILDTYIGCQEENSCYWTSADEGHPSFLTRLAKLFRH
jgi:hypothetical protein